MGGVSRRRVRGVYSRALAERICAMIAAGASLRRVGLELGIPRRTIQSWIDRYAAFKAAYVDACEQRLLGLEDRLLDLCDEATAAAGDAEGGRLRLDGLRLQIDTLKFMLSKLVPQRYGDRTQMEITGKDGAQLLPAHTREEDVAYLSMLAAVRSKTPPVNGIVHE